MALLILYFVGITLYISGESDSLFFVWIALYAGGECCSVHFVNIALYTSGKCDSLLPTFCWHCFV